ncbi:MAG: ParA family protein [Endomicrobium sp.]|jgi:chromosome partitioning protein|nr:ParA family protein [Endomicrobium sp.]
MKKVLLILNQKGGVGKSTLSIHLTRAFKEKNYKSAVIDTDMQGTCMLWSKQNDRNFTGSFVVYGVDGNVDKRDINSIDEELIVIDTPPRLNENNKELIELSNYIIIPAAPTNFDLWATDETIKFIKNVKPSTKIIIVINNISQNRSNMELDLKKLLEKQYTDIYVCDNMIYRRNAYIIEPNFTVFERKNDKAKREIINLVNEILDYIGE